MQHIKGNPLNTLKKVSSATKVKVWDRAPKSCIPLIHIASICPETHCTPDFFLTHLL